MMKSARADDAVASAGPTPDRPGADVPPAAGAIHYYMGSGALSVGRASPRQAHSSAGVEDPEQASEQVEDPDDLEWRCGVNGCNRPRAVWQEGEDEYGKYRCCCRTCGRSGGAEHGPSCGYDVHLHHAWAETCTPHPARRSYQCWGGPEAYIVPNGVLWSAGRRFEEEPPSEVQRAQELRLRIQAVREAWSPTDQDGGRRAGALSEAAVAAPLV